MTENTILAIGLLDFNKGQLQGLPKNPRFFRDYRYEAMKKSIEESPEMLELRELIVYPYPEGRYIVVCGNLRLRACKELGYKELPCKILNPETDVKKLREYATKDNVSFGENDVDVMVNEWDKSELQDWGVEFSRKRKPMSSKSGLIRSLMKPQYIPWSPNTMRSTSCSSFSQVTRLIATGSVSVLVCSVCAPIRPAK